MALSHTSSTDAMDENVMVKSLQHMVQFETKTIDDFTASYSERRDILAASELREFNLLGQVFKLMSIATTRYESIRDDKYQVRVSIADYLITCS